MCKNALPLVLDTDLAAIPNTQSLWTCISPPYEMRSAVERTKSASNEVAPSWQNNTCDVIGAPGWTPEFVFLDRSSRSFQIFWVINLELQHAGPSTFTPVFSAVASSRWLKASLWMRRRAVRGQRQQGRVAGRALGASAELWAAWSLMSEPFCSWHSVQQSRYLCRNLLGAFDYQLWIL